MSRTELKNQKIKSTRMEMKNMKYTVKQIADRAGVSKTTVTKYLKRLEKQDGAEYIKQHTQKEPNGTILLSDELSERLVNAILKQKDNRQPTANPTETHRKPLQTVSANPVEEPQTVSANPTANPCKPPQTVSANPPQTANPETIAALNRLIETQQAQIEQLSGIIEHLKEQITVKDNQLTAKDSQIEQLSILTSQAQALNLKALETVPEQNEAGAEETEREKFILFRMFRKKKGNDK